MKNNVKTPYIIQRRWSVMEKYEKYEYHIMIGILSLSALLGIGIGYLVFGPLHATAIVSEQPQSVYYQSDNTMLAGLMYDESHTLYCSLEQSYGHYYCMTEVETGIRIGTEETHSFIVTSYEGYVAILHFEQNGKLEWQLHEITTTPVSGLSREEQERLIVGIPVYTQEELTRILQDYGS